MKVKAFSVVLFGLCSYKELLQEELNRKQKLLKKLETKITALEKTNTELERRLKHMTAPHQGYVGYITPASHPIVY